MYWLLGAAAVLAAGTFSVYNSLVTLRSMVRASWADVDVQLKRRTDLIPSLVACVKGYASHEETVLTAVANARSLALNASGATPTKSSAETSVGEAILKVVALAESYPELKAGENFQKLQVELTEIERHIASARQYYNACVRDYNTKRESFPASLLATSFKAGDYFELDSVEDRLTPSVA